MTTEVDIELFDNRLDAIAFVAERGGGIVWVDPGHAEGGLPSAGRWSRSKREPSSKRPLL